MRATRDVRSTRRFFPFLPFLFLGIVFVGHGPLAILVSLLVSLALTAGISFLLLRPRARSEVREQAAAVFIAPASSAGLQGVLRLDAEGIHWMPRHARLPLWFVPWEEVVRTEIRGAEKGSQLSVELAGGDALALTVDSDVSDLERALGHTSAR
jgi:hypothetical protein